MGAAQGRTTQARTTLWDLLGQTIARREVKGSKYSIPKLQKDLDMPRGEGGNTGLQYRLHTCSRLSTCPQSAQGERTERAH